MARTALWFTVAMIKFGAWSVTLALGSLHGLTMAALLWRARRNVAANRWLAALLAIFVLMITPYTIGYAGFYDAYPWLTFAPFDWQLGIGPLIWLYVRQVGSERLPTGWGWHFGPLMLQVGYYTVLFCLPLETKWRWNDAVHERWLAPAEHGLVVTSIVAYLVAAGHEYRAYQHWLVDHSAAREELRLGWLRGFLLAMALTTAVAIGFGAAHLFIRPLSYFDEFPLYIVYTMLVWYLGVEGWRHAGRRYPGPASSELRESRPGIDIDLEVAGHRSPIVSAPSDVAGDMLPCDDGAKSTEPTQGVRDWKPMAERIRQQVLVGQWWRDPELELAEMARRVGTNTNYLSRALNEGLRMSFSEFINRLRVEEAQQRLLQPGEVLAVAFEVGFRSKASFNRAFKAYTGTSPSEWRASRRDVPPPAAGPACLES